MVSNIANFQRDFELTLRSGKGFHPFQILFARMSITVACSSLYMYYKKTEHFPWGLREVRGLLVARGLTGFFGVFGMYCKFFHCPVQYDNVLEATLPSMLAPSEYDSKWLCCRTVSEHAVSSITHRSRISN
jgi:hypothetical protein